MDDVNKHLIGIERNLATLDGKLSNHVTEVVQRLARLEEGLATLKQFMWWSLGGVAAVLAVGISILLR